MPLPVVEATSHYLLHDLAAAARAAFVDFVGGDDPAEIAFGAMTTLTFQLSRVCDAVGSAIGNGCSLILGRASSGFVTRAAHRL